jgi:hypothetical protein
MLDPEDKPGNTYRELVDESVACQLALAKHTICNMLRRQPDNPALQDISKRVLPIQYDAGRCRFFELVTVSDPEVSEDDSCDGAALEMQRDVHVGHVGALLMDVSREITDFST